MDKQVNEEPDRKIDKVNEEPEEKMHSEVNDEPDRVAQLFKDKTVLITGATGFVGKALLEKMLRSCSGVRKVYVLIRNEEDKDSNIRLKEMFESPFFRLLKSENASSIFSKVEAVSGDITLEDMGVDLSELMELYKEVEIIYHCAANVRSDIPLKDSVLINVRGTKYMLDFAKECQKLIAFIHVSTVFCHFDRDVVFETTRISRDPQQVITICEYFHWEVIEKIRKDLLGRFSDCYHFTKALSEYLVAEEMSNLPVIIIRPSFVTPIWKEPLPGYCDHASSTGLLTGTGKGLVRTMFCKGDARINYIPVDTLANTLLFTAFDSITHRVRRIYNAVSFEEHNDKTEITAQKVVEIGKSIVQESSPFKDVFWYPEGSLTQSKLKHYFILFFFQLLPAFLLDSLLIVCRIKPYFMKVQENAINMNALFNLYANWKFNCANNLQAIKLLNDREKQIYYLDGSGSDFCEYFKNCVQATQSYILQETQGSRKQMRLMWCLDKLCRILVVVGFFYVVFTVCNHSSAIVSFVSSDIFDLWDRLSF